MRDRVWVPRQALAEGDLPPVCVRTGRPADGLVPIRFRPVPAWTWLLLPFGVLPFLVANLFAGELVVGDVPVTRSVVDHHHRWRGRGLWLGIAAVVGVGLAVLGSSPWVAGLAVACGLTSLGILAWRWATWITVKTDRNGLWVRLSGVDGAFAQAVADGGYGVP